MDRKPPQVTLLSAEPSVVATGLPGETPSVRLRYRGPKNKAPVVRVFRTDDGKPHIVRRFRGGPNRGAVWDGQVSDGPGAHRPGAGGRLRLHGRRARPRRERDRGAAPGAAGGGGAARARASRCAASRCAARCRPSRRAPTRTSRSGRWTAASTGSCRGSAIPRPFSTAAAWPAASASGSRARRGPASTWCASAPAMTAPSGRSPWPACRPAAPAADARPLVVLPALTWQGLNRVDDDADGFGDRLPFAKAVRLDRPFAGGGLPPALRRRGLAAAALARPRAARVRPHHRPRAGPARGPGARERPGRGVRRQRALGAAAADGAPARLRGGRRPRGGVRRRLVQAHDRSARRHRKQPLDGPGARTRSASRPSCSHTSKAPLTVFEDGLGLFEGLSSFVGEFTVFEVSRDLPRGARRITAAGRDAGQPGLPGARPRRRDRAAGRNAAVGARARGIGAQPRAADSDKAHLAHAVCRRKQLRASLRTGPRPVLAPGFCHPARRDSTTPAAGRRACRDRPRGRDRSVRPQPR